MPSYSISSSSLKGSIRVPSSKSHTLRALLFALMAGGKSRISHYLHSPDTFAMTQAIEKFGAKIAHSPYELQIEGIGGILKPAEDVIDAGNSGIVLRFIGALAALSPSYTVITGDASIRHRRPVVPLLEALEQLGAFAVSSRLDGYAPIIVKGCMKSGKTSLSGEDSQPVSALLIATSFLEGPSIIEVTNPGEKPWIDLTLHWLSFLGIKVQCENYTHYIVEGNASYPGFDFEIPGDFSSAAFPLAAALITHSEIEIENLDPNDPQGDKKLIDILIQMRANIKTDPEKKAVVIKKTTSLQGTVIDVNDCIDAVPILAVIGCFAEGKTEIIGAKIARQKESDRLHAMASELSKMGAKIEEKEDGLIIHRSSLKGAHVFSHHDQRVAMALSVAALAAQGPSLIEDIDCIAKTYPTFAKDFRSLGATIQEVP